MKFVNSIILLLPFHAVIGQTIMQVHGSGTTNPSKCYWQIMDELMDRAKLPSRLTYRAVGSSTGQAEFKGNDTTNFVPENDFASGDIPVTTEDYELFEANNISIVHLPVMVGAVSLFHSIPDVPQGENGLNLTSCLIAKIFSLEITDWLHPDITAENPNLRSMIGQNSYPITVGRRSLGSSSTSSVTAYLRQDCPNSWPEDMVGSVVEWANGTKICEGSAAMTSCIRDFPGTIGYIDSGHGHAEGLVEIELRNANGVYLSSLESSLNGGILSAITSSTFPSSADEDFGSVELLNQPGDFTWPIVVMSYIYVRKDLSHFKSDEDRALFLAFLTALYDPTFIDGCKGFGFAPVVDSVRDLALAGIAMLNISSTAPAFFFEVDTASITGQGDYVISSKRRTYAELERADAVADLESLVKANQMLSERISSLEGKVAGSGSMEGAANGGVSTDDEVMNAASFNSFAVFTSTDQQQIMAALVMSSISIALWGLTAIYLVSTKLMNKQ